MRVVEMVCICLPANIPGAGTLPALNREMTIILINRQSSAAQTIELQNAKIYLCRYLQTCMTRIFITVCMCVCFYKMLVHNKYA